MDKNWQITLFWLWVTLASYGVALKIYRWGGGRAWLNPVLGAVLLLGGLLWLTKTPYSEYQQATAMIHFLLGPATVALAVPIYQARAMLRRWWLPLGFGLLAGSVVSILVAVGLGYCWGVSRLGLTALAVKSVTTPVAIGIAEQVGGSVPLTIALVIIAGMSGAVLGPCVLNIIGVKIPNLRGFAMGVASHGIGTSRALQESTVAGGFSGLGMGLHALWLALTFPWWWSWLGKL